MAKFYGSVGYAVFDETSPGVFEEIITEKKIPWRHRTSSND